MTNKTFLWHSDSLQRTNTSIVLVTQCNKQNILLSQWFSVTNTNICLFVPHCCSATNVFLCFFFYNNFFFQWLAAIQKYPLLQLSATNHFLNKISLFFVSCYKGFGKNKKKKTSLENLISPPLSNWFGLPFFLYVFIWLLQ